jgi:pyruvate dehydrogenase E2 component (dihydrolipoamide acetyltransferase)
MSVEVVMPQMGESIAEGTVTKWLKKIGDRIEKDEPLLEISTDKVDAEVPAPASGVLLKINVQEGQTVPVGTAIALIGEASEAEATPAQQTSESVEQSSQFELKGGVLGQPIQDTQISQVQQIQQVARVEQTSQAQQVSSQQVQATKISQPSNEIEVVMPQMGESIAEGTVTKWLKKIGDRIEKDEPLLEISTDKVDAEVPAPASGVLLKINVQESQTVPVGTVIAVIGKESTSQAEIQYSTQTQSQEQTSTISQAQTQEQAQTSTTLEIQAFQPAQSLTVENPQGLHTTVVGREQEKSAASISVEAITTEQKQGNGRNLTVEELRRKKSSPLVRNIAKKHGIDISKIQGTGISGRVTKKDILAYIESGAAFKPQELMIKAKQESPTLEQKAPTLPIAEQPMVQPVAEKVAYIPPTIRVSAEDRVEPMSIMRKKIAEHMVFSKRTSAHVTTVYEIDMTNVAKFREQHKAEFQARYGTKLTYMPFIFQAVIQAIKKYPIFNAQVSGDQIIYKGEINLGMAVALDWGLIVPVIKRADTLSLAGLALVANDLADRARAKKLSPDEVQGGTFTITNPGVFGGLFGTPIINQPQVAILCVGVIEKRPKVITTPDGDDVIAIRQMAYFALTYDHRIIDGADAEKFLSFIKQYLETTNFSL